MLMRFLIAAVIYWIVLTSFESPVKAQVAAVPRPTPLISRLFRTDFIGSSLFPTTREMHLEPRWPRQPIVLSVSKRRRSVT